MFIHGRSGDDDTGAGNNGRKHGHTRMVELQGGIHNSNHGTAKPGIQIIVGSMNAGQSYSGKVSQKRYEKETSTIWSWENKERVSRTSRYGHGRGGREEMSSGVLAASTWVSKSKKLVNRESVRVKIYIPSLPTSNSTCLSLLYRPFASWIVHGSSKGGVKRTRRRSNCSRT